MKRAVIVAMLAALVALPASGWAQGKPDFSGSWKMDDAKSDPAPARAGGGGGRGGGRGGGPAAEMTIKQTPAELAITRAMGPNGDATLTYKLDGSESTNTVGRGEVKSKASWEGSKLVITSVQTVNGPNGEMTVNTKDVYSLAGANLMLETTRSGGNMPEAQTRKIVYAKQ